MYVSLICARPLLVHTPVHLSSLAFLSLSLWRFLSTSLSPSLYTQPIPSCRSLSPCVSTQTLCTTHPLILLRFEATIFLYRVALQHSSWPPRMDWWQWFSCCSRDMLMSTFVMRYELSTLGQCIVCLLCRL